MLLFAYIAVTRETATAYRRVLRFLKKLILKLRPSVTMTEYEATSTSNYFHCCKVTNCSSVVGNWQDGVLLQQPIEIWKVSRRFEN